MQRLLTRNLHATEKIAQFVPLPDPCLSLQTTIPLLETYQGRSDKSKRQWGQTLLTYLPSSLGNLPTKRNFLQYLSLPSPFRSQQFSARINCCNQFSLGLFENGSRLGENDTSYLFLGLSQCRWFRQKKSKRFSALKNYCPWALDQTQRTFLSGLYWAGTDSLGDCLIYQPCYRVQEQVIKIHHSIQVVISNVLAYGSDLPSVVISHKSVASVSMLMNKRKFLHDNKE